jgi:hypothetical protein
MNLHRHTMNLNRPACVPVDKLTAADIDECIARRQAELDAARPKPLPPMSFEPASYVAGMSHIEAAHAASEIDDDLPTTASDRRIRAVLAWAYVAAICAVGYLAIFY